MACAPDYSQFSSVQGAHLVLRHEQRAWEQQQQRAVQDGAWVLREGVIDALQIGRPRIRCSTQPLLFRTQLPGGRPAVVGAGKRCALPLSRLCALPFSSVRRVSRVLPE